MAKKKAKKKAARQAKQAAKQAPKAVPLKKATPTAQTLGQQTSGPLTSIQPTLSTGPTLSSGGGYSPGKKAEGGSIDEEAFRRVLSQNPQMAQMVAKNPGMAQKFMIDPVTAGTIATTVGGAIAGAAEGGPTEHDVYGDEGKAAAAKSGKQNDDTRTGDSTASGATSTQGGKVRNEGLKEAKEDFLKKKGIDPSKVKVNKNGEPVIPKKYRDNFKKQVKRGAYADQGLALGKGGKIQGKTTTVDPSFQDTETRTEVETAADEYNKGVLDDVGSVHKAYSDDAKYGMEQRRGVMDYLSGTFQGGAEGLTDQDRTDIQSNLDYNLDNVNKVNRDLMQKNMSGLLTGGMIDSTQTGGVIRDQVMEGVGKATRGAIADNAQFRQQMINDKANRINQNRNSASGVLGALTATPLTSFTQGSVIAPGAVGGTTSKERADIASGNSNDAQSNRREDAKLNLEANKRVVA